MQQTLPYPARPRRGALAAGLAISFLLHVVLLALLRTPSAPPAQREAQRWAEPLTIRIVPPPPRPAPVLIPVPAARVEPPPKAVKPAGPVSKPASQPAVRPAPTPERMATEPSDNAAPTAITVMPAPSMDPAPQDNVPRFDPNAARAAARAMANDLNPSTNWAAEKLNKGKEWKETKEERLGRNVANSARGDCRTAYAGAGLLAPLYMLMDKKDSGCKW